jgi:uncharacterized membrane protein
MTQGAHLWAVAFDDMKRAAQVRAEIARLGEKGDVVLLDTAVAIRYPDGGVTLNGESFVSIPKSHGHSFARFLAVLALGAPPLTGSAVGALVRATGGSAAEVGIGEDFIQEVQALMNPGTSVLFVLDREIDMPAVLRRIQGLGGTVLKTNVDVERARLIQSTLAATADQGEGRP